MHQFHLEDIFKQAPDLQYMYNTLVSNLPILL